MKPFFRTLIVTAALGCFTGLLAPTLNAQLVLNVNTSTQELSFSGSDSGAPYDLGSSEGQTDWSTGSTGTSPFLQSFDMVSGLTSSAGIVIPPIGWFTGFGFYSDGDEVFVSIFTNAGGTPTTFTATNVVFDYSILSPTDIAQLEGLIGSSLPLTRGTGFGSLSITAVPEPSTYVALLGLGALGFVVWNRRRHRT